MLKYFFACVAAVGLATLAAPPSSAADEPSAMIYVRDSPMSEEEILRARRFAEEERYEAAAELLHELVRERGDTLVAIEPDLYTSVAEGVRRVLSEIPQLGAAYRIAFGPEAQRRLTEAMNNGVDESRLRSLAGSYWYTRAGQEASLLLAGLELERGDAEAAADRLVELSAHPDAAGVADRREGLLALARLLSGRSASVEEAVEGFTLSRSMRRDVEAFSESLTAGDGLLRQRGALPELGAPLHLLPDSLWEVRFDVVMEMGTQAALRRRVQQQFWSQSAGGQGPRPVVAADRIVVKVSDNLYAVDRDSGRLLWRRESGLDPLENIPEDPRMRQRILQQVARQMQASGGGMTVAGNDLVAIVGASSANAMRYGGHHGNESAILKLDASTGRVAWRRTPGQLDESLAGAAFTGDPLLRGDTAYAFVARQQRSGLRELMLAAVSLSDASLRWTEHVSSLATSRHMRGGFVPPQMSVSGSRLYASDGIATVACFDAPLGRVLWTRILPVSQRQLEQGLARASSRELSSRYATPIRVAGGILVNLAPLPEMTVLIDADTGRLLRELRGPAWGGDNLLLPWKSDVISVHPDQVARFDGESLETVWSLEIESSRLQGTPSFGHRFAALPTERGVLTIDLEQGKVMRQLGTGQPGHAILLDGQIVLSDRAGLVSYLSWEQTSQRLRRAIADQPTDPAPALDLTRIALEIDRREPLNEALDAAVEAVTRRASDPDAGGASGSEARRMVFEELRELAQHAGSDQAEAVGMLLAKLGRLADTPRELATYHLLQGKHDAEGNRREQAVEHFQQVLANERLSNTLFQTPRASRRAAVEARRQLGELLEAGDADLYAAFRAEARSELATLTEGSARAPGELESLARRYPFAPAAAEAMLEAGRAYHVMDRHADALHALRQADDLAKRTDADRGPILGELVDLYLAMGEPDSAARELRRIARDHPELELVHGATRRTASAWLTEVAPLAEDASTLPLWGPPLSEPRRLDGAPVLSIAPQPRDGVVLFSEEAGRIVAMAHDTLEPVWSTKFEKSNEDAKLPPVIVARSDGRIVLWRPGTQELIALLESDGSEAWRRTAQDVAAVEQAVGRDAPRRAVPEQEARARDLNVKLDARHVVMARNAAPIVIHGRLASHTSAQQDNPARESLRTARATLHARGQRIAWALPSGHFAVLRLRDGQSQWLRRLSDGVIQGIRIGETGLAIWGRTGDDAAASGVSQVLHVETGEPMTGVIETQAPAVDAGVVDDGLILAMPEQVRRYDVNTGEMVWRSDVAGASIADGAWFQDGVAVYVDDVSNALAFDTQSGEMLWRKPVGLSDEDPVQVGRRTPGGLTLLARSGLARFDMHEGLAWRDAVMLPRKRLYAFELSHRHAIIAADDGGNVPIFGDADNFEIPPAIRLFLLDRDHGQLVHQFRIAPAPAPTRPHFTRLTDHWLVLSDGQQSLLLRGEPEAMPKAQPESQPPADATTEASTPSEGAAEVNPEANPSSTPGADDADGKGADTEATPAEPAIRQEVAD